MGETTYVKFKYVQLEFKYEPEESEYFSELSSLSKNIGVNAVMTNYITEQGKEIGMSDYFYVKLKRVDDQKLLQEMATEKNVEILEQNRFMPLWYTLRCTKYAEGHTLDMANEFYETGFFSAAVPDFLYDDLLCANDTDFDNLWGLQNTANPNIDINICQAWDITEGAGVDVAILDQGIDLAHNDLQNNISANSYDTESDTAPSQLFGDHGTHVSGTVAAVKDNNLQVVGVAPHATLLSISNSLQGTPNSRIRRADGINWAWQNGADIINNSWGSAVQYDVIDDAVDDALANGRNGLGTLVIFATGNDNGNVNYPANSNPDIIAVGALNMNGNRSNFSNFGNELDVVAPGSDILSTTNENNTATFNGTSMAAPHVAGVAALILSVNPNLTHQEVADIIESTAQKVGGYAYTNNGNRPNGTWNNEMGYGLVDAFAAIQQATPETLSGPDMLCYPTNETFTLTSEGNNVVWSVSSNAQIVSSNNTSATVRARYSHSTGDGWVTATLNNNVERTVHFGVNQNLGDDPMTITVYRPNNYYIDATVHGGSGETPYSWYLNNQFSKTTTTRTATWYYTANSVRIEVRNDNACGNGQNSAFFTGYIGGSNYYSAYPNPASNNLTVERTEGNQNSESNFDKENLVDFDNVSYRLIDFNKVVRSQGAMDGGQQTIDVSALGLGLYILEIDLGIIKEVHKIIIDR